MASPEDGAERENTEPVAESGALADGDNQGVAANHAPEAEAPPSAGPTIEATTEPVPAVPSAEPATPPPPTAPDAESAAAPADTDAAEPDTARLPAATPAEPPSALSAAPETPPQPPAPPAESAMPPLAVVPPSEPSSEQIAEPATVPLRAVPSGEPATTRLPAAGPAEPPTVPLPIVAGWDATSTRTTPAQRGTGTRSFGAGLPGYAAPLPGVRTARGRAHRLRRPIVLACAAFALVLVLAGIWGGIQLSPPSGTQAELRADVQVARGETTAEIATQLQRLGLIRDARVFELYASVRGLDGHLVPGIYHLSAAMGVTGLVGRLAQGQPDAQPVTIPAGLRATQYPSYLAPLLPRFDTITFLRIAQTGTLPDGTALASRYWYVPARGPSVAYALEGYLAPGTYAIPTNDDAAQVANLLVAHFGEQLCPGPDAAHLDAYLADAAACLAHAAPLSADTSLKTLLPALEQRFGTSDPRTALYDGLTLAALVARTAPGPQDAAGIAAVYYNRYLAAVHNGSDAAGDSVQQLDAPAAAQYARDTDHPPASGVWWAPLSGDPAQIDPSNPYNASASGHTGLIPGPIATTTWQDLAAVASASSPNYYLATACGTTFYAASAAEALGMQVKVRFVTAAGCPANQLTYPTTDVAAAASPADLPTARLLPPRTLAPPPLIGAAYVYLMNPQTGQVLFAQGADGEHPMASTTKLMTALVAVTYGKLDQRITVGQDVNSLAGTGASLAGLQPGETLTLRELLYALLLPSGDDAGIVIADGIAGSQSGFVWLMNDEARLLGLTHTHYANPHGLDEAGHYTSAADLAWLATVDLQHAALAQIVGTESLDLPATADHPQFDWVNTNELLWPPAYPGVIGVKTGYTGGAGYCLVFAAKGPSGMLVGVILDDYTYTGRFTDARALLDWGFAAEARTR